MKIKKTFLFLSVSALLFGCNPQTKLDDDLLEDLRDSFINSRLIIKDTDSSSVSYSNAASVGVEVLNDAKATKWCLSETQKTTPVANCNGGLGSENGWHITTPTSFTLSAGDGAKTLYLWFKKESGAIRGEALTSIIILDTTAPTVTLNPFTAINFVNASSYTLTGSCSDSSNVSIDFGGTSYAVTCSSSLWSLNRDATGFADGPITVNITQKDFAGNVSVAVTDTISKDTAGPTIVSSSPANGSYINDSNKAAITFSGTCSEDGTINISGSITNSAVCNSGTFSKVIDLSALADGARSFNFDMNDSSGNPATQVSVSAIKDVVIPTASLTAPAAASFINNATKAAFTISGTCSENGRNVSITGSAATTATCALGVFSKALDLSALPEGAVSFNVDHSDLAGNSAVQGSRSFNKDTIAPVITQTTYAAAVYANTNTVVFGGACVNGDSINISGADTSTSTCSLLSWSYTTAAQVTDANYNYIFTHTDAAGNSSSTSSNWNRDQTPPTINSISINGGVVSTGNSNTLVNFNIASTRADINSFCLKYNITATPSAADTCWKTLASVGEAATNNLTMTNYPFRIGTVIGDYDVRLWAKDDLGNISSVSNAGAGTLNTDLFKVAFDPDPAPSISNTIASLTDSPNDPLTGTDTTVTIGNSLYIKWNITDNNPIPAGNIELHYTLDDVNYTLISGSLNNTVNGACSAGAGFSGCFHWAAASPSSSFYKIKVSVTDSGISSVFSISNPINTGNINFLSGNTSLGIGGSATSAILIGEGESNFNDQSDPQALVVTKNGFIFYKYKDKGIVYISPENGLLKTLLKDTGSISGDGGSVFLATARNVRRIALDYDENIIVYDDDQIRKIDLSSDPWSISTIAGGGANAPENEVAVLANLPYISGSIVPTPNGRIYFPVSKNYWYLDPTDSRLKKHLDLTGFGTGSNTGDYATYDISKCWANDISITFDKSNSEITKLVSLSRRDQTGDCGPLGFTIGYNSSFNLTTGVSEAPHPPDTVWSSRKFTGLDGKMYVLEHGRDYFQVYNAATNSWDTLLGNGSNGRCSDGTPALSCSAYIMSAFVNEFGKVYFVDMGVIRFIDDSGNVQTLAGQPRNFGIGFNPISARYSQINFFDIAGDDVYVKNKLENQIVKFSLNGGNLVHIAGNGIKGAPTAGQLATNEKLLNCGWSMPCSFKIDSVNSRLYHHYRNSDYSSNLGYIDLTTGLWVDQSSIIMVGASRLSYLGFNGSKLVSYVARHYAGLTSTIISEIAPVAPTDTTIFGDADIPAISDFYCVGSLGTDCTLKHTQSTSVQSKFSYDSANSNWLAVYKGKKDITAIPLGGGVTSLFETTVSNVNAFIYRRDGANEFIYYCATNGNLYKRNVQTDVEAQLAFPTSNMKCDGNAVDYHAGRDSVIFIYKENGLYGIAEYKNP